MTRPWVCTPSRHWCSCCSESAASSSRLAEKQSEYSTWPREGRDRALTSWRGRLRGGWARPRRHSVLPSIPSEAGLEGGAADPISRGAACRGSGPAPRRPLKRGRVGEGGWALCFPTCLPAPRPGLPGKQLHSWVPPRALLRWEAGPTVVGPCCCGRPVTEEPGLAAWDDLEVQALRGRWEVLGSAGQECIEVL